MPKKNCTKPAADDVLDAEALSFLQPLLRKWLSKPTSRAKDNRIRRGVRKLSGPLLTRVAERVYMLSALRFEAAKRAYSLGMKGVWADLVGEASGTLASVFCAVNAELEERAIDDVRELMVSLVDALQRDDRKALAMASRKYRSLPLHTRDWWQAWNHSYVDYAKGDVPGADYDFEPIEFADGASELRSALNRRRKRRERSG